MPENAAESPPSPSARFVCDPFARNRYKPGDERQGKLLPSKWWSESTLPWRVTGKRGSEAGRKGDKRLAISRHRPKQVAMDNDE